MDKWKYSSSHSYPCLHMEAPVSFAHQSSNYGGNTRFFSLKRKLTGSRDILEAVENRSLLPPPKIKSRILSITANSLICILTSTEKVNKSVKENINKYEENITTERERENETLSSVHSTCSKISLQMALQLGRNM